MTAALESVLATASPARKTVREAAWQQMRLKYVVTLVNRKATGAGEDRPYVGLEHIEPQSGRLLAGADGEMDEQGGDGTANEFEAGDVLFGKLRPYLAKALRPDFAGRCSSELLVLRPKCVDRAFLFYFCLSADFLAAVDASTYGSKMPRASWDFIGNYRVALPPLSVQREIAAFLDDRTARIDALIERNEEVLTLLDEQLRSVITTAITRGLDSSAATRETTAPWIGSIPEHWGLWRLKHLRRGAFMYGANAPSDCDDPAFPRYIRITDVDADGCLRDDTFRSLPDAVAAPYLLEDGDLLLARSGATVGKAILYQQAWGPACFAGYLIRLRPDRRRVLPAFLAFYTQSQPYWTEVSLSTIQATIQNVSAERYGDFYVPLPPLDEQRQIVDVLSRETSRLRAIRDNIRRLITTLREYRQSVIAAAVSGRLAID